MAPYIPLEAWPPHLLLHRRRCRAVQSGPAASMQRSQRKDRQESRIRAKSAPCQICVLRFREAVYHSRVPVDEQSGTRVRPSASRALSSSLQPTSYEACDKDGGWTSEGEVKRTKLHVSFCSNHCNTVGRTGNGKMVAQEEDSPFPV